MKALTIREPSPPVRRIALRDDSLHSVAMLPILVRLSVFLLFLLVSSPTAAQAPAGVRLRAGDAVRLEVQDEPLMKGEYGVDETGRVLLPLVGNVTIAGRDFEEVRREVDERYAKELQHRQVRLTPLVRVAVLGEVRLPGLYPIDPTMALADVLALAGGFNPDANRQRIELQRGGSVVAVASESDAASLTRRLESGDQVVVARNGWARTNAPALIGAAGSLVVAVLTTLILR